MNKLDHIAFIMDGNGRWATEKGLKRTQGHHQGAKALENIVKHCHEIKIPIITFFAFSTENWNRPKEEVDELMKMLNTYVDNIIKNFSDPKTVDSSSRLVFLGDLSVFDKKIREKMQNIMQESANRAYKMTVNIAINYGGKAEILNAVNNLIKKGNKNINEDDLRTELYTSSQPDPDLIIRTSGELRMSNFLLWQGAYSELSFPKVYWPDFTPTILNEIINEYNKRERRHGKINVEIK